jgi:ribosomal protein S27AE
MSDEMYTTKQAALYVDVEEVVIRILIREGKLRAWSMPLQPGLLVRKSDLEKLREAERPQPPQEQDNERCPACGDADMFSQAAVSKRWVCEACGWVGKPQEHE